MAKRKAAKLKLWKLTREDYGYDEYDGCVVVAKTKEAAIEIGRANCSCTFTSCEEIPMNGEVFVLGSFNAG
jgi:hypothetical protein